MIKKHMKRCSLTPVIIREMQIKTTLRYHLTMIRMAIIKESTNKNARESGEKEILPTLLVVMQTGIATGENNMEVP